MATHSSNLTWGIHGQRSLAGYSPWGRKESARLSDFHFHPLGVCDLNQYLPHLVKVHRRAVSTARRQATGPRAP